MLKSYSIGISPSNQGFEEEERGELRLRHEEEQADEPDVRYRVEKLNGSLVGEENSSTAGGRARQLEGHHSVSATMSQVSHYAPDMLLSVTSAYLQYVFRLLYCWLIVTSRPSSHGYAGVVSLALLCVHLAFLKAREF